MTDPTSVPDDGPTDPGFDTTTAPGGLVADDAPPPDLGNLDDFVRPDAGDDDEPAGELSAQSENAVARALAAPPGTVLAWDENGDPIEAHLVHAKRYGASAGYGQWLASGRPWSPAYPVADLASLLRGYGYTVYILGDSRHMNSSPPEDHTPFSATGWPVPAVRWWVHALDIMPPSGSSGLPSVTQLMGQVFADKMGGIPGASVVKYMNWSVPGGQCVHDSWEPGHQRVGSSDVGHGHVSIRSDMRLSRLTAGYDPVARFRAGGGVVVTPVVYHPTPIGGHPAYPGRVLRYDGNPHHMLHGSDVGTWQARMRARGWAIGIDGWYGNQSENVATRFQQDSTRHGWPLHVDGEVGPNTWRASWERPVS